MTSFSILDDIEKKFKKKLRYLSKVLNTFENSMENGAFAPLSKCSIFHNLFKYMIFHRHQKALLWIKGLKKLKYCLIFDVRDDR